MSAVCAFLPLHRGRRRAGIRAPKPKFKLRHSRFFGLASTVWRPFSPVRLEDVAQRGKLLPIHDRSLPPYEPAFTPPGGRRTAGSEVFSSLARQTLSAKRTWFAQCSSPSLYAVNAERLKEGLLSLAAASGVPSAP
jgi:hypothetical protein